MFGIRAAVITVPLAVGLLAGAAVPAGAHPAGGLTCRGAGVDPAAQVRHRTETVIDAPLDVIWKLQTDVGRWPAWQRSVATAERLDHGRFRAGSAFHWTTPLPPGTGIPATALDITSTVRQVRDRSCVRWTGPADGEGVHIDGVHVWNFTEVRGGVRVSTEETHTGPQVDANVPLAKEILRAGLEGWLADLGAAAQARAGGPPPPPPPC
ncbi:SRPBCC family protein [Kitasatospora sp. NPDC056327]|uniref:SRPBCC family protein n=1 Tax=Kitasatospora sp. NPDC056327 TaxID=3345785 RepID=UPI0035E28790